MNEKWVKKKWSNVYKMGKYFLQKLLETKMEGQDWTHIFQMARNATPNEQ